jgi:hypothetical protein
VPPDGDIAVTSAADLGKGEVRRGSVGGRTLCWVGMWSAFCLTHYEAATRASQLAAAHKGKGGEDAGSSIWTQATAFFPVLQHPATLMGVLPALVGYILATQCLPSATSPDLMAKGMMPFAMSVATYLTLRKGLL